MVFLVNTEYDVASSSVLKLYTYTSLVNTSYIQNSVNILDFLLIYGTYTESCIPLIIAIII